MKKKLEKINTSNGILQGMKKSINQIIDYLDSCKIIGDNKTTSVTKTDEGYVIHAIPTTQKNYFIDQSDIYNQYFDTQYDSELSGINVASGIVYVGQTSTLIPSSFIPCTLDNSKKLFLQGTINNNTFQNPVYSYSNSYDQSKEVFEIAETVNENINQVQYGTINISSNGSSPSPGTVSEEDFYEDRSNENFRI